MRGDAWSGFGSGSSPTPPIRTPLKQKDLNTSLISNAEERSNLIPRHLHHPLIPTEREKHDLA
jgi:hypothetical protein